MPNVHGQGHDDVLQPGHRKRCCNRWQCQATKPDENNEQEQSKRGRSKDETDTKIPQPKMTDLPPPQQQHQRERSSSAGKHRHTYARDIGMNVYVKKGTTKQQDQMSKQLKIYTSQTT